MEAHKRLPRLRIIHWQPVQPLQVRNPKPPLAREGRPHSGPQLLVVACKHYDRIRRGKATDGDETLGLCGVPCLVNEDM